MDKIVNSAEMQMAVDVIKKMSEESKWQGRL